MTTSPASHTFLWHDYETFGADTRRTRPAQFAAIRTDADLNEIGAPLMLYCQPANDFLPEPQACLITGITPQECLEKGIPEYQFAAQIEQAFSMPGTVGVGYNTIRFDDEITRFMFWRNLIDPYAREWQNDCGRWDLLDVARTAYALRPDGIEWPLNGEGKPSFKLTDLSAANGLLHESAHDALSDVRATIALARLLKTAQPKLFDFCFGLHKKDRVMVELGLPTTLTNAKPFLHISGMFAPERGCLALMWPLAMHPANKNELLAWDLAYDPRELAGLNAEQIRLRLFTKTADLPQGLQRLPIKSIHLNKSPSVIGNTKTLSSAMAQRWGLNLEAQLVNAAHAQALADMSAIWPAVFKRPAVAAPDVDEDLYGGFVGNADRRRLNELRQLKAPELASARPAFDDARLLELFWRYRARNFPQSLSAQEQARWEAHRSARLFDGAGGALTIERLFEELDSLAESADERGEAILGALYDYAEMIAPQRA
ncbi:MAG: exodeoxyribonuclease I [Gammaproteobacteria bacterium]|uniref:exodeoxyribonuclease I n=1 Tax=Rhodoferax sp. TaxID=50421 RepID=UPI001800B094|nr:exodeoxyribonuclease I [Rhodoferax sp.]MBU3899109.1 exodeoxyribonuclease I [Gammaproteobacteria bacterium]MBA3057388.1 exodeoxyribonuclease I [Rhodoferax sp.]MBU3997669.1 exodeoxyribonuclease I [Gammaproteobacteria bacterium]MBU4018553.1 exodeoxyribonuclease I [Gammaproteobacteria bacterium]MBU4080565.1 exodeoxyribonuclease I [Gammaproteobacteria bacterium]